MSKRIHAVALACLSAIATTWASDADARILFPGESLVTGEFMPSEDGRYLATMQHDGNFVVYSNDGLSRPIWSTDTTGRGAATAIMQRDGNFVLYDRGGRAIWDTKSNGRDRVFTITEHGQAVVLAPGRVGKHTPGPGTVLTRRLGFKTIWTADRYDRVPGRRSDGPYCIADPHTCGAKLHGN